jgi:hypothetical protein
LVKNAGVMLFSFLEKNKVDDWERMVLINWCKTDALVKTIELSLHYTWTFSRPINGFVEPREVQWKDGTVNVLKLFFDH